MPITESIETRITFQPEHSALNGKSRPLVGEFPGTVR